MLACRPMVSFALAVMAGAAAMRLHPALRDWLPYGSVAIIVLVLMFIRIRPKPPHVYTTLPPEYERHIASVPGFLASRGLNRFIILACCGLFVLAAWRQSAWERSLSTEQWPANRTFSAAMVMAEPMRQFPGQTGRWQAEAIITALDNSPCEPLRVMVSGMEGTPFLRGDSLTASVRQLPERPKLYPGAFDPVLWLERDGLAATLWVNRTGYTVIPAASVPMRTSIARAIDAIRGYAIAGTIRYGGDDGPTLAAMLYGYRSAMSTEIRDTFRRVGIGHVLAISGLHVGLIVGLLWWLSGWFGWTARYRALVCLVLAIFYLGLSGGQVAAQRATLMAGIHLGSIAWGRRADMLNSLGAAALCITLANPSAPFDISFQLSFTAVIFIHIALYIPRTADKPRRSAKTAVGTKWARMLASVWSLTRLSIATWFGLFPIVAAVFNQVNLVGLPINILVIPLMSLVLQGGLLVALLGWIPGAAWLFCLPSRLLTWLAVAADGLPYASFPAHAPAPGWSGIFYALVFCWLLRGLIRTHARQRIYSWIVGCVVMLGFVGLVMSMESAPPPSGGRIAVLPGGRMPLAIAESASGSIALIGNFSKAGLAEAGWLHHVLRSGAVSVVHTGNAAVPPVFAYHYTLEHETAVPMQAGFEDADAGWRPVPGTQDIDYAVSRDGKGKLAWIAVRTGDKTVTLTSRLSLRQFTWRLENAVPGSEARLFSLDLAAAPKEKFSLPATAAVALGRPILEIYPPGWFDRTRYGALVLTDELTGYDGVNWVVIEY